MTAVSTHVLETPGERYRKCGPFRWQGFLQLIRIPGTQKQIKNDRRIKNGREEKKPEPSGQFKRLINCYGLKIIFINNRNKKENSVVHVALKTRVFPIKLP